MVLIKKRKKHYDQRKTKQLDASSFILLADIAPFFLV